MELNLEGIHLDMGELIKKYNGKIHSCSDGTEIQQISLFCQNNRNDYRKPVLMDMINPMFGYAALYPQTFSYLDTRPEIVSEVTDFGEDIIKEIQIKLESIRNSYKK